MTRSLVLLFAASMAAFTAGGPQEVARAAADCGRAPLGWRDDLTGGDDRLDVATTVAPISSIARNIGGERIRLRGLVPDGANSHTFAPRPSDARHLAAADVLFANGLGLEQPMLELAAVSMRPDAPIVRLADATIDREEWLFDETFPESAGDPNPHLWMSVPYARRYAELIAETLADLDPANADLYAADLAMYVARLDDLDARIRAAVATVPPEDRRLLTYHDSWAYWAREYGFEVIGAVQASDFADPSARDVAALIEQVRREDLPAIFGSEVFPSPVLEQIAREAGAAYVDALRDDRPPGDEGSPEHTYLGMLRDDMIVMLDALGGDGSGLLADLPVEDGYRP